jgi:hypothetical protein
MHTFLNIPWIG